MVEERISRFSYAWHEFFRQKRTLCCMAEFGTGYLFLVYSLDVAHVLRARSFHHNTARKSPFYNIQNVVASPLTLGEFWAVSAKPTK